MEKWFGWEFWVYSDFEIQNSNLLILEITILDLKITINSKFASILLFWKVRKFNKNSNLVHYLITLVISKKLLFNECIFLMLMAHNLKSARQVGKARVSFVFQHEFLLFFNIFKNPTTKSGKSILLSKQHPICGKLIILNKQNHLLFWGT